MKKKQKKKSVKKQTKRTNNREYSNILLIFTGIFVLMIGYLVHFQVVKSRDTINNPYNARLETFGQRVIRGSILAADGQLLAYTRVEEDGKETRVYPFGCTFSHVLGYSEYGRTGIEELGNFQLLTSNAYFVELSLKQVPRADYVRYTFAFWEGFQGHSAEIWVETAPETESARTESGTEGLWHTVRRGETLWGIARDNGLSLTALIALNPQIKNPNLILTGEKVRLE